MEKKMPIIFVVSGAFCVGKTTVSKILIERNYGNYIVLNGSLCSIMTFPGVISGCRKTWVDICCCIAAQTNLPVVFYDDLYPDAFDGIEKEKHDLMRFVALVCDKENMRNRVEKKLGDSANDILSKNQGLTKLDLALLRNEVYRGKTAYQYPQMDIIDTTDQTPQESADALHRWILMKMDE